MKAEERKRISRLLEQDKDDMNEESRIAARRDFIRVAREYFDVMGEISLTLTREKAGFRVDISFQAERVKNFTTLK